MRKAAATVCALLALSLMAVSFNACNFSFSTAKITGVTMLKSYDKTAMKAGEATSTYFRWSPGFYAMVKLANVPSDTKVTGKWFVIDENGTPVFLDSSDITIQSGEEVYFSLPRQADKLWPYADYKLELILNGKHDRDVTFKVVPQYANGPITEICMTTAADQANRPLNPTDVFPANMDPIYACVYAAQPAQPTLFSIGWYQETPEGPGLITSAEITIEAEQWLLFSFTPTAPLPKGKYFTDIMVNQVSFQKVPFTVE